MAPKPLPGGRLFSIRGALFPLQCRGIQATMDAVEYIANMLPGSMPHDRYLADDRRPELPQLAALEAPRRRSRATGLRGPLPLRPLYQRAGAAARFARIPRLADLSRRPYPAHPLRAARRPRILPRSDHPRSPGDGARRPQRRADDPRR